MKRQESLSNARHVTLNMVPHGRLVTILGVLGTSFISLRLMEMGLVPGASISVVRSAPLGDPIQVKLRDYHLALRRAEAELIHVTFEATL